jgi:hypothetical protein
MGSNKRSPQMGVPKQVSTRGSSMWGPPRGVHQAGFDKGFRNACPARRVPRRSPRSVVSQGRKPTCDTQRWSYIVCSPWGVLQGVSNNGGPKGFPQRGSPMGRHTTGSPMGVPQGCSPRVVLQAGLTKRCPRGFRQGGLPNCGPPW